MLPNNINDAIQAARDGEFGLFEQVKIGDIVVDALTDLDVTESLVITRKKVMSGLALTDMAIEDQQPISMGIVLANPEYSIEEMAESLSTSNAGLLSSTWRDNRDKLFKYKDDLEILTVQTHDRVYENVMIQAISPLYDADENWDAFFGYITFERVHIFGQASNSGNKKAAAKQDVGAL